MVRVFDDGELISEITPELWMLGRYSSYLEGLPSTTRRDDEVTVVSRTE
jgi:diadenylate cyclase